MKKLSFLFVLAISHFYLSQNQKITGMEFYYGFSDYKKDSLAKPSVYAEVKSQNEDYIKISPFRYTDTDKKAKKENRAWLMKYQDNLYFSMTYAAYIYSFDTFARVHVIGKKYFLIYLDEVKDKKAISYNNPYGGGLLGGALNAGLTPKFAWKDKKGNSYKVLLIDIEKSNNTSDKRDVSFGLVVDTKLIVKLTDNDPEVISKLKTNQYYLEDIIDLVNKENNK
ncbi:hypothetical protein LIV57_13700 [Chryseobacterium sp. X308]|uniref:hypothetical protein n=1 Tax=Chryseobacterium sp. X308 TaxID=2884873 RepID=UPI001D14FB52|nr:hypothetical protein [Chryseobacterium sp. X308]MCC3216320.1 hypothetical protein [Chryseobacterium sp. X308]